jgi:iron complex transport system permease protein
VLFCRPYEFNQRTTFTMPRLRPAVLIPFLALLALLCMAAALLMGSVEFDFGEIIAALLGKGEPLTRTVILELRLPRALAAFTTGGLLALAGCLMQVLLRNPLADPYILGISSGAAVCALAVMALGLGGIWLDAGAFGGATAVTLLVFALAHGPGGWTPTRLLLTGVVIASGLTALMSLILALSPEGQLRGMMFWLMGDLSMAKSGGRNIPVLVLGVAMGMIFARHLNVLSRGELPAEALGLSVKSARIGIYLGSSLITALAVTTAGSIGFIGLVVPHLVRLVAGPDHRVVIPGSVLLGGALLTFADLLARTLVAPIQLPVGALTALIGVPLFLLLLGRQRQIV